MIFKKFPLRQLTLNREEKKAEDDRKFLTFSRVSDRE